MAEIRFIHCADLHIDTPFKGISRVHPELLETLKQSTYQSLTNIVDLALEHRVDFVAIAGDVFDSADKSLRAQMRFRNELLRLSDGGIPSYLVFGNHDPLDGWSASLQWPDNVIRFGGEDVESYDFVKDGRLAAKIYGISFKTREITENLALRFPDVEQGVPTVGLLHTNVGENTGHKPYAPASVDDLLSRKVDYWALGHVHTRQVLRESTPVIVYSGCTQARHPREIGEKGCYLVTLRESKETDIEFVSTDVVRYRDESIDISDCDTIDDVKTLIVDHCRAISNSADNRITLLRTTVTGRNDLHEELTKGSSFEDLNQEIQTDLAEFEPAVWLDKTSLETAMPYDIAELRKGADFAAEIISHYDKLRDHDSEYEASIGTDLDQLFKLWTGQKYLENLSDDDLMSISEQSLRQVLNRIVGAE